MNVMPKKQDPACVTGLSDSESKLIAAWLRNCAFGEFFGKYTAKINKKLASTTAEDRRDVFAELAVAHHLLLIPGLSLTYEPFGIKTIGPDFEVAKSGQAWFFSEVKRIRPSQRSTCINTLMAALVAKLRYAVPEWNYTIDLNVGDAASVFEVPDGTTLKTCVAKCIDAIVSLTRQWDGKDKWVTVPLTFGEVRFGLHKSERRDPAERSGYLGGAIEIPYTQSEHKKIADDLLRKLRQLRAGSMNLLVILSDGDTHEDVDFEGAVTYLMSCADQADDTVFRKAKLSGASEFLDLFRHLSAVALKFKWSRQAAAPDSFRVWRNPRAATPIAAVSGISRCFEGSIATQIWP